MKKNKAIRLLDIIIDAITKQEVLRIIKNLLYSDRQHLIVTINAEFVMLAQKDEYFKSILNNSSLRLADGSGILWAAKFLSESRNCAKDNQHTRAKLGAGHGVTLRGIINVFHNTLRMIYTGASLVFYPPYCRSVIPERISGTDLMVDVCRIAEKTGKSVYLIGGRTGIAKKAAEKLKQNFSQINIVGAEEGIELRIRNQELRMNETKNNTLIKKINITKPDILFVAFGHPKQEYWIAQNLKKISSVRVVIGVGGAFDFISGTVKRAPFVFRTLGIEWLFRLFRQPWRVPRVFTATAKFVFCVVVYRSRS